MKIRPEKIADTEQIFELTKNAFATAPHSGGNEAEIVDLLRKRNELIVSLVAVDDTAIVGHVAFSNMKTEDENGTWYSLGPISVSPERQGEGIGSMLIRTGFESLKALNATGCVLVGDPNYYSRFGFVSDNGLTCGEIPSEYIQYVAFSGNRLTGDVEFSAAFKDAKTTDPR